MSYYQSRKMSSMVTFTVIIVLVNIQATQARKCFVCGKGSEEPFFRNSRSKLENPDMNVPLSCEELEASTIFDKFIYACPSEYVSCLVQIDGTDVMRTCGDVFALNDCKTANGIDYCYCTTDLCNKRMGRRDITTHFDDEDTSDDYGPSGYGSIGKLWDHKTPETTSTSEIPEIEPPSPVTVLTTLTTVTTTTEAVTVNQIFTTNQNESYSSIASATAEATNNATNRCLVKCSKVIFILQLFMLIYLVAMLS